MTLPRSTPQQLPSTSFPINYSFIIRSFNTTQSEVQKAPLNKLKIYKNVKNGHYEYNMVENKYLNRVAELQNQT
jgi:hypothetical protein